MNTLGGHIEMRHLNRKELEFHHQHHLFFLLFLGTPPLSTPNYRNLRFLLLFKSRTLTYLPYHDAAAVRPLCFFPPQRTHLSVMIVVLIKPVPPPRRHPECYHSLTSNVLLSQSAQHFQSLYLFSPAHH